MVWHGVGISGIIHLLAGVRKVGSTERRMEEAMESGRPKKRSRVKLIFAVLALILCGSGIIVLGLVLWFVHVRGTPPMLPAGAELPDFPREVPRELILRVETGTYAPRINKIAVDAAERILVSGSDDATVRVWDLESGRLLKVLRIPIAQRPEKVPVGLAVEGRLHAVAVSPDGKMVAVGGFTRDDRDGSFTIYLFNAETGSLFRRLTGLGGEVSHLSFSKDGRYLAATEGMGREVFRVYETTSWTPQATGTGFGGLWADFSGDGSLAVTDMRGFVHLYDRSFHLVSEVRKFPRNPTPYGPYQAVFSPDGKKIAVCYGDAGVDVLSADNLSFLYSPNTSPQERQPVTQLAWSPDGQTLYTGGRSIRPSRQGPSSLIRAWSQEGKGPSRDYHVPVERIPQILSLHGGKVVYTAADPYRGDVPAAVAILDEKGDRPLLPPPPAANYGNPKPFLLSMPLSTNAGLPSTSTFIPLTASPEGERTS